ncbi:MAG TPA: hypothetical protein VMW74_04890 [Nitrosopumilaceae archaeon]|nr:hypothetical protein [Nitrosopumilaceae archaeon]
MFDSILDDVQILLEKEFGDKRILEQIQRAAKNNEVISNFERNYVRKLAEKHLGRKPLEPPKQVIPDVVIPTVSPIIESQTVQMWSTPSKIKKSNSNNTKIILGVGLAALVIIIIAAASLSGISDNSPGTIEPNQTPNTPKSFSIKTDLPSYQKGDIISITGESNLSFGNSVILSIKNSVDELVWSEQANVKIDGQFTTLTFAGGSGWEKSGTFTIMAESDSEKSTNTFSFIG